MGKKLRTNLKKNKQKIRFFGTDEVAELSGPIIRLCSNKEMSVDGCRNIVDYYENLIKLNLSGGSVTVTGNNLCIVSLTDNSATIKGNILNVEFCMKAVGK